MDGPIHAGKTARERVIEQLEKWATIARRQTNLSTAAYDQSAARLYEKCAEFLRQKGDQT